MYTRIRRRCRCRRRRKEAVAVARICLPRYDVPDLCDGALKSGTISFSFQLRFTHISIVQFMFRVRVRLALFHAIFSGLSLIPCYFVCSTNYKSNATHSINYVSWEMKQVLKNTALRCTQRRPVTSTTKKLVEKTNEIYCVLRFLVIFCSYSSSLGRDV